MRFKIVFLCVVLVSCKSTQTTDDYIDKKLEAYNLIQRELCHDTIKDYSYFSNDHHTNIRYKCVGSDLYNSGRGLIYINLSENKSIFSGLIKLKSFKTYSGWSLEELILFNSDYMEFSESKDTKNIQLRSLGVGGFEIFNRYKISLAGNSDGNKEELKQMHEDTISFLHKFQSFSCNGKPLNIKSIEWFKYAYNMSSAKMSCNGKSFNVNFANDLNMEKSAVNQILFQ